jgi:DNA-binding protein YbaB
MTEPMTTDESDAQLAAVRAALREVQEVLATKRVTCTSSTGAVTASADGNGKILALSLTPRVRADVLGPEIRDAINGARSEAARRGRRLVVTAADAVAVRS